MAEVLCSNEGPRGALLSAVGGGGGGELKGGEDDGISILALLLAVVRRSVLGCSTMEEDGSVGGGLRRSGMEIGWPSNVRHVAHVTFDRFHGFLGLPVELQPEVPRRAPSASATVFGVSTESMQCSYDSRGNSVPTILLLMQRRLYDQGGLRAEGIFRINAENSQEEFVRDQLNNGTVPVGIDVHCLAGLIKAWFRELPRGILDSLPGERVMECQSEEECGDLVKLLPPAEAALLDWAVNLMADVVQEEEQNKMNARNVAMVFAPNMTQMLDPLTALMYAVQVMNFLKMLILRVLKERQEPLLEGIQIHPSDPSDKDGSLSSHFSIEVQEDEEASDEPEHVLDSPMYLLEESLATDDGNNVSESAASLTDENHSYPPPCRDPSSNEPEHSATGSKATRQNHLRKVGQSSKMNVKRGPRKRNGSFVGRPAASAEKAKCGTIVSRINSKIERVETWR